MSDLDNTENAVWQARLALLAWKDDNRINYGGMFSTEILCQLFGVTDAEHIDIEKLRALAGPHGWTYYKMLLARWKA